MLVIPRRVYLFHQAQGTIVVFIHEDGDVVGTAGGGDDNGVFGARDGVIGVMGGGDGALLFLLHALLLFFFLADCLLHGLSGLHFLVVDKQPHGEHQQEDIY